MHYDRRQLLEERFRTLLLKWLARLPPEGWKGTSHELGDELHAFGERHRQYAFVPTCPGRKVAALSGFLAANGYTLSHRRTKHARTLRFVPLPRGSALGDRVG